ncbi:MAG: OmpH family outer membrane protein [Flavobacteriaceae bacterium]|nr:OmpH family outer membrane protein [Flavobacteriaceae bacterium]
MKKLAIVLLGVMTVTSCQQEKKIGFVDNVKLVNDYQEKKDVEADYTVQMESFRKRADSASQAFQLEIQQYQVEFANMAAAKRQEAEQLLGKKQQFLQQQFQGEEQEIARAGQVKNDTIISKIKRFVKQYGKDNGYTYILGANNVGSVMYGSDENDLTQTILEALNKEYEAEKN